MIPERNPRVVNASGKSLDSLPWRFITTTYLSALLMTSLSCGVESWQKAHETGSVPGNASLSGSDLMVATSIRCSSKTAGAGGIRSMRRVAGPLSRSDAPRDAQVRAGGEESMSGERRAGSWRRSDLTVGVPQCILELRETFQTVGVSEREIGRIHPMCLSISPLRDPVLTMKKRYGLVSNESADTTDGEQYPLFKRLSHRSGRRLTSRLSALFFTSHTRPPSFTRQEWNRNAARASIV